MLPLAVAAADVAAFDGVPIPLQLAIVGGILLMVLFVFPFWLMLRYFRRSRELLNAERIKALELGQPPIFSAPDKAKEKLLEMLHEQEKKSMEMLHEQEKKSAPQRYGHGAFWVAFWVGAVVPIAAAGSAASVTSQAHVQNFSIVLTIWISVTVICVASVVCATVLMVSARRVASEGSRPALPAAKKDETP